MVWGHPPAMLWSYTPKQAAAWATLGMARKRSELAEQLMITATGAQGKSDTINERLKELEQ